MLLRSVPEAAVTDSRTPDDGCDGHPKHVEWFCSDHDGGRLLLRSVPEAAVTDSCTPDDGCDGHPKHVQ